MPDFFVKQLDAITQLDARNPVGLLIYLAIISMLIFQYYREGADVFREYGRLQREIKKEKDLKTLYSDEWEKRLTSAVHFFHLGNWLVLASLLLLALFVGLMLLLGDTKINVASSSTTVVVTAATSSASATAVVVGSVPVDGKIGDTDSAQNARNEAQRLLGVGFICFCIFVAVWLNFKKYDSLRLMYDFSNQ